MTYQGIEANENVNVRMETWNVMMSARKFYTVESLNDCVRITWGRVGTLRPKSRVFVADTRDDARDYAHMMVEHKADRHGYEIVGRSDA